MRTEINDSAAYVASDAMTSPSLSSELEQPSWLSLELTYSQN